jgi:hypothetical protein
VVPGNREGEKGAERDRPAPIVSGAPGDDDGGSDDPPGEGEHDDFPLAARRDGGLTGEEGDPVEPEPGGEDGRDGDDGEGCPEGDAELAPLPPDGEPEEPDPRSHLGEEDEGPGGRPAEAGDDGGRQEEVDVAGIELGRDRLGEEEGEGERPGEGGQRLPWPPRTGAGKRPPVVGDLHGHDTGPPCQLAWRAAGSVEATRLRGGSTRPRPAVAGDGRAGGGPS